MGKTSFAMQKLGGSYQLVLEKPEDLAAIEILDEAHWTATSAPCTSFACDPALIGFIDADGNGRIRTDDLKLAQNWLFRMLSDRSRLSGKNGRIALSSIDSAHEEGASILSAAKKILAANGSAKDDEISLEMISAHLRKFVLSHLNGDGIIPPESAPTEALSHFLREIMGCSGSAPGVDGKPGINAAILDKFLSDLSACLACFPAESKISLVQGIGFAELCARVTPLRNKLDEYFVLCRLAKQGMNTRLPVNPEQNPALSPLAPPNSELMLPCSGDSVNPIFRDALALLAAALRWPGHDGLAQPLLSAGLWDELKSICLAAQELLPKQPGADAVSKVPTMRLREISAGGLVSELRALFEEDLLLKKEMEDITRLEKLALYQKWFLEFANNFVSLHRVFDPSVSSMIQAGTLVMDGRHFRFCVKVTNRDEHKKLAEKSNICTMYVKVSRQLPGGGCESMEVAAAVTSGTMNNLFIGKSGIFFTPDGQEWDAQTVDFIKQPVSFSEALKMPFGLLGDFIRKQSERFTASRYKELETSIEKGIIQPAPGTPPAAPSHPPQQQQTAPPQQNAAWNGSMLMLGGSVGVAALGSSFAFIFSRLAMLNVWKISGIIAAVLLIIGGPVVIAAVVKLHRRNLGVFIEACGWSINAPMRLTRSMGLLFTCKPELPDDVSRRSFELTKLLARQQGFYLPSGSWIAWGFMVMIAGIMTGFCLAKMLGLDLMIVEFFKI